MKRQLEEDIEPVPEGGVLVVSSSKRPHLDKSGLSYLLVLGPDDSFLECIPSELVQEIDKKLDHCPIAKNALASCSKTLFQLLVPIPKPKTPLAKSCENAIIKELVSHFSEGLFFHVHKQIWTKVVPLLDLFTECLRQRSMSILQLFQTSSSERLAFSFGPDKMQFTHYAESRQSLKPALLELGRTCNIELFVRFYQWTAQYNYTESILRGMASTDNLEFFLETKTLPTKETTRRMEWCSSQFNLINTKQSDTSGVQTAVLAELIRSTAKRCLLYIHSMDLTCDWEAAWAKAFALFLSVDMLNLGLELSSWAKPMVYIPGIAVFIGTLFSGGLTENTPDESMRLFLAIGSKHSPALATHLLTDPSSLCKKLSQWITPKNAAQLGKYMAESFPLVLFDTLVCLLLEWNYNHTEENVSHFLEAYYTHTSERVSFRASLSILLKKVESRVSHTRAVQTTVAWIVRHWDDMPDLCLSRRYWCLFPTTEFFFTAVEDKRIDTSHVLACHKALLACSFKSDPYEPLIIEKIERLIALTGPLDTIDSEEHLSNTALVMIHLRSLMGESCEIKMAHIQWALCVWFWYDSHAAFSSVCLNDHIFISLMRKFSTHYTALVPYLIETHYHKGKDNSLFWCFLVGLCAAYFENTNLLPNWDSLPSPNASNITEWRQVKSVPCSSMLFLAMIMKKNLQPEPGHWITAFLNAPDLGKQLCLLPLAESVNYLLQRNAPKGPRKLKYDPERVRKVLTTILEIAPDCIFNDQTRAMAVMQFLAKDPVRYDSDLDE